MAECCTTGGFPTASQAKSLARNNTVIWSEINAIQQAILAATSGCEYDTTAMTCVNNGGAFCVTVSGKTPMTYLSQVSAVNITVPGQDYFPVIATATFTHPVGIGATADVVVTGSVVTSITITAGGFGYAPIPAVADFSTLPGSAATATLIVDSVTGAITDTVITDPGINYSVGQIIPVTHLVGTGAILTIASVGLGGEVQSITITAPGQDYQTIVTEITVTHPTGIGFDGVVQVALGAVIGVAIQDGGLFYNDLYPTIFIDDLTGNGSGATTVTEVGLLGELTLVTVTFGGANYSAGTIGTVVPAPTSAGADGEVALVLDLNPYNTIPYNYYLTLLGQLDDCGLKDQMEQVTAYFCGLGYDIQAQVNPDTNATIQWEVCWC